jgi:CHAT domain-containing protein
VDPDGISLLEQCDICLLSSSRDLLRPDRPRPQPGAPVVVACPDYELTAAGRAPQFSPLPGTRAEADVVARRLGVAPWTGTDALKHRVLGVASPRVLHVATHGYFLQSGLAEGAELMGWTFTIAAEHAIGGRLSARLQSPLLRSGLALAGANAWLRYEGLPPEAGDGMLTAEDVAGMDLAGTELVVLSACDTGLGDIRVGEGVMGLRRSFMVAGARTLIMSVWKVPDLATFLLVDRLYANLLERSMACDESLREAQLFLRGVTLDDVRRMHPGDTHLAELVSRFVAEHPDADARLRPFLHEAYWGGFVCLGDPRPLAARR